MVMTRGGNAQFQQRVRVQIQDPIELAVGEDAGPQAFTVADVNNDGKRDIVAASRDDDVAYVLLGEGGETASFGEAMPFDFDLVSDPVAVLVADVTSPFGSPAGGNADNNPDILVADEDGVEILFGSGDGTFTFEGAQDLSDLLDTNVIVGIAIGDFDKTGPPDLAVLDDEGASTKVFFCAIPTAISDLAPLPR